MSAAVRKEHVALIEAFAAIKAIEPVLWAKLDAALRVFAEPETKLIIRVPPDLILVAQGRAQVAEDLLRLAAECSQLAASLKPKT